MNRSILTAVLIMTGTGVLAKEPTAKIGKAQAAKAVKELYKDAVIKDSELEKEDGKRIWSFDLSAGGKAREVWVDANTGAVIKDVVETPADEADEKVLDKAEAAVKARVHGEVVHGELRMQDGKSVAAFTVKTKHDKVWNVIVDAKTDKIISKIEAPKEKH
jgi:uncharacterized membrane protein YkoI